MKMWNLFIIVIIIIDIIIRIIGTGHRKVKIHKFSTYFFIFCPQKCVNHIGGNHDNSTVVATLKQNSWCESVKISNWLNQL